MGNQMEQIQPAVQPVKRGVGRPAHVPTASTRKYVEALASYGIPEEDIARVVGVARVTLRAHYRDELLTGQTRTNAKVAGFLFKAAEKGNVAAMTFWLKCRANWHEPRAPADEELGKKAAAVVAAQRPDNSSEFGKVLVARSKRKRDVGSVESGMGGQSDVWPVSHTGTATQ
jgi:hypothetical protein